MAFDESEIWDNPEQPAGTTGDEMWRENTRVDVEKEVKGFAMYVFSWLWLLVWLIWIWPVDWYPFEVQWEEYLDFKIFWNVDRWWSLAIPYLIGPVFWFHLFFPHHGLIELVLYPPLTKIPHPCWLEEREYGGLSVCDSKCGQGHMIPSWKLLDAEVASDYLFLDEECMEREYGPKSYETRKQQELYAYNSFAREYDEIQKIRKFVEERENTREKIDITKCSERELEKRKVEIEKKIWELYGTEWEGGEGIEIERG